MLTRVLSARAFVARGLAAALFAAFTFSLIGLSSSTAWSEPKDIKWGTGPVGSSGHKALVVLADILNKEMPEFRISVLPYPGAVGTVKGFATGELDGYYGSDVALKEFAADAERFKGFKAQVKIQPVQSFWCYTLDVGLAIKASDARHDQEVGRPHRQERLHRPAAVRHPQASRERAACARRQARLQAGRPEDRRLAAQLRLDQGHDHLRRRRRDARPVDLGSLARGRLGGAQPERGRTRQAQGEEVRHRTGAEPTNFHKKDAYVQDRSRCCRSTGASTSA